MVDCDEFKGSAVDDSRPLCPSDISPTSGGNRAAIPALWIPAFAGMTVGFVVTMAG